MSLCFFGLFLGFETLLRSARILSNLSVEKDGAIELCESNPRCLKTTMRLMIVLGGQLLLVIWIALGIDNSWHKVPGSKAKPPVRWRRLSPQMTKSQGRDEQEQLIPV